MSEGRLTDDILRGAPAIAEFIGENERRAYHLLESGTIPCGKIGSQWVASKRKLTQFYDRITGREAA